MYQALQRYTRRLTRRFKSEFMRYIQTFVHDKSLNLIQIKHGILRCEAFFTTEN
jgi:hypothetical protein